MTKGPVLHRRKQNSRVLLLLLFIIAHKHSETRVIRQKKTSRTDKADRRCTNSDRAYKCKTTQNIIEKVIEVNMDDSLLSRTRAKLYSRRQ